MLKNGKVRVGPWHDTIECNLDDATDKGIPEAKLKTVWQVL